jgi:hypothetical protein
VNERKDRLNTGSVPKPYDDSANEDFVVVDVISLQHRPRFAKVWIKNLPNILKMVK